MPDEPKRKRKSRFVEDDPAAFTFEPPKKSPAEAGQGKHKTPAEFDRAHPPKKKSD